MFVAGWGAATNRGLVRGINEDALLADPPVFLVADGMGGHAAGDLASRIVVESFMDLVGHGPIRPREAIAAISAANAAILRAVQKDSQREGMGTTVSGLASVVAGGAEHWMVFNVGDSRVYRLSGGNLEQLTLDHSEVEELVAAGRLSRSEAHDYARRNVITRALGMDPEPVPDSWVFPPLPDERFLVCSDGLNAEITDVEIAICLRRVRDPQVAADDLVRMALAAGARDNVTAIVVDGESYPQAPDFGDTAPRVVNGA